MKKETKKNILTTFLVIGIFVFIFIAITKYILPKQNMKECRIEEVEILNNGDAIEFSEPEKLLDDDLISTLRGKNDIYITDMNDNIIENDHLKNNKLKITLKKGKYKIYIPKNKVMSKKIIETPKSAIKNADARAINEKLNISFNTTSKYENNKNAKILIRINGKTVSEDKLKSNESYSISISKPTGSNNNSVEILIIDKNNKTLEKIKVK